MARSDPSLPTRAAGEPRLRQQLWALHAYESVASVGKDQRKEYGIAVNDLGANVLRSGLAAAMAALERKRDRGGKLLLEHLATAGISGLEHATGQDLPDRVRRLDLDAYLLATREVLQLATWFRRAVQATFEES
ncbi:MAG TPA: type III-B CRISPR module-associated protein Cmr5 [Candidatus Dormibacteraeota bacterium]|jgi:CRISPR-associated protein Cmr5|nr:type III-B CRISPR module-associated protein Cmr5 [Candidatus Dormibacteraeota bacterium]